MDKILSEIVTIAEVYEKRLPPLSHTPSFKPPLAAYLDCALHSPDATPEMVQGLCREASENKYASVFINPIYVTLAKKSLEGTGVHVGTVAGFPLGGFPTDTKVYEARNYVNAGADEIDMVMSVGLLKAGDYQYVLDDIRSVVDVVHPKGGLVKVILETVLLNQQEKITACLISKAAGADFVKTSTGFSKGGATAEDIDLMRRVVGPEEAMGVKAAGGIHTLDDVMKMIQAGANRLGTRLGGDILIEYQSDRSSKNTSK